MRKITAGLFITLDGVVDSPNEWTGPYFHPRIDAWIGSIMGAADCMLIGRVQYEEFAAYWPHASGQMADVMNGTPKYVVSNTLERVDWQNCTLIDGDVLGEIKALKGRPGRNIGITGSRTLVASLLEAGLIDELHLCLVPIVLGKGKRLFETTAERLSLNLAACESLENGVVLLTYGPQPTAATTPTAGEQPVAAGA
jgi:dihydrofolate reductase